ncbi:MAG: isopentenyl-diphosphate Delta-isomerase [Panacagrimonas sp.]
MAQHPSATSAPCEEVVLVDARGEPVGVAEKQRAHLDGALHRAFSIFVFNTRGELLMQQRAATKYHSGGLWTNTCCGHPRPGEALADAAHRRLREEMGFDCMLREAFHFTYHAQLDHDLIEHEFDHVFVGRCNARPTPNPQEVGAYVWMSIEALAADLAARPERYTYWLRACFDSLRAHLAHTPLQDAAPRMHAADRASD